jgi:hypothetical protein
VDKYWFSVLFQSRVFYLGVNGVATTRTTGYNGGSGNRKSAAIFRIRPLSHASLACQDVVPYSKLKIKRRRALFKCSLKLPEML